MTAKEATSTLERMLDQGGIDYERPDALQLWSIFKAFGRIETGDQADQNHDLLFHCDLTSAAETSRVLSLVIARRFTRLAVDDDYDTEQVGCILFYESQEFLHRLATTRQVVDSLRVGSFDFADLEEFYAGVEELPEFELAMRRQEAVMATMYWSGD